MRKFSFAQFYFRYLFLFESFSCRIGVIDWARARAWARNTYTLDNIQLTQQLNKQAITILMQVDFALDFIIAFFVFAKMKWKEIRARKTGFGIFSLLFFFVAEELVRWRRVIRAGARVDSLDSDRSLALILSQRHRRWPIKSDRVRWAKSKKFSFVKRECLFGRFVEFFGRFICFRWTL